MPPIRTLLVVDTEGFTRHRDVDLPGLYVEMRRAVATACERSGLADAWKAVRFVQGTGDGVLAVFPLDAMTQLIHPFADHLQAVLAECAPRLPARGCASGYGSPCTPVSSMTSTRSRPASRRTNDVSRLLDCEPLRAALRDSDPNVTFVAAVVSAEAFDMFVRGGHTGLPPSRFTQVRAKVKQFDRPAFLYVPTPSEGSVRPRMCAPATPDHDRLRLAGCPSATSR